MRESDKHFQRIVDAAPVMLCVAGVDKRCTFFNRAWLAFTGHTLQEQLASGWTGNVHPDDLARCIAVYAKSFNCRREFNVEFRLRRADGEYRWVLANGAPHHTSSGVFAGYVTCCADFTDSSLVRDKALVHKNLEVVGALASGIAHDFNNLLGNILSSAEVVLSDLPPHSGCSEEVGKIRDVAIRASEIVRELMVYSGQDKGSVEPVDLSLLTKEMLNLLAISITKHARLTTDLADSPPAVVADAAELRQLLMNLILNASDALEEADGEIHVATSSVSLTRAQAGKDLAAGNYLRLEVSDTGRGVRPESQDRIFDPYFTTKPSGKGLGLGVVRGIVQRYGGSIQCTSAPGEGAHFVVLLPSAGRAAPDRGTVAPPPLLVSGLGRSVLLVEDEEGLRIAVANLLRRKGFRITEARDGSAAVELIRKNDSIDAIVLDLTLPGMSSPEFIAEAARIRPGAKIVLTSAYSRETAEAQIKAPQVKAFIRKPYRIAELVRVLAAVMSPVPAKTMRTVVGTF